MPKLNFAGQDSLYATHGLHSFAAKCPPQLVRYGLHYYSKPGDTVIDPMSGSGTTLVESRLMGRHSLGFEIDSLARLVSRVKSKPISDEAIGRAYDAVRRETVRDLALLGSVITPSAVRARAAPPDFPNRDRWFDSTVSAALAILSYHIGAMPMPAACRDFLWVAFSSLILARTSVANARDIIHSRHHFYEHPSPPDVMLRFDARVKQMRKQMADFRQLCEKYPRATALARSGDARHLRLDAETVDLVFTSPPYATALDYPRAHFLAVAWMQKALGVSLAEYKSKAPLYIGSEYGTSARHRGQIGCLDRFDLTASVIDRLDRRSPRHARLTQRYFEDMYQVLNEMQRVLKEGRHAIVVVCPSHIRKLEVPTHEVFVEMGKPLGLKLKAQYRRAINERLRLLPYMKSEFGKRMLTEYVLIFKKIA